MARLIDANEIKRQWEIYGSLDVMDRILADVFPTADVVEVVRCKDCMYGAQEELFDLDGVNHRSMEWHCVKNDLSVVDDWFCADGEKVTE